MKIGSVFVYQGIPLFLILFPFAWFGVRGHDDWLKGEHGIIENLTVVFLFAAIALCLSSLLKVRKQKLTKKLNTWLFILIAGAGYFALEELSYGQHLFGWGTTEAWKELNDQDETNLHNVSFIFDQWPRAVLTVGIFMGGVILPLYRRFRNVSLDESSPYYWQLPTMDCVTIGLAVILIRPFLTLFEVEFIHVGETKESYIALFILLYCASIHGRLGDLKKSMQAVSVGS
jgi:hypothetical protein